MKVLMVSDVYPPLVGGQEREIRLLSEAISRKKHQVIVCTLNNGSLPSYSEENGVRVYRIEGMFQRIPHLYRNPQRKFHPPVVDWIVARNLQKIVKTENPDIIHTHGWMLYSILPLQKTGRIPLCVTFHDYGFVCPIRCSPWYRDGICHNPPTSPLSQCLHCERKVYGLAKSLLCYYSLKLNKAFTCDVLVLTNPYILEKMSYIEQQKIYLPHPIDTDEFRPIETEEYEDRILVWAKLDRIKGIDIVFKVARLLPEYRFNIIFLGGDKEYYKAIKPSNVTLLPEQRLQEIPEFINKYPLIIGQFLLGAFGHAELEAMSCGKPVTAYWNRKYDAFYETPCPMLSSRDVNNIAYLIRSNIGNKKLGASSRRWILENHSVSKVVDKLINIYRFLIEKRNRL